MPQEISQPNTGQDKKLIHILHPYIPNLRPGGLDMGQKGLISEACLFFSWHTNISGYFAKTFPCPSRYQSPDQICQSFHRRIKVLLRSDAESGPEILTGFPLLRLEGLAGHQHDVRRQPSLHDHLPRGGETGYLATFVLVFTPRQWLG